MSRRRTFGSIRTLSSGRYQARYTSPDGARHRAPRSFATKAEASQWLAKIETEFARGTWTDPDAGRVSLDGYARSWVETRANLRPRTVDLYESLLEHHIVPALGDHEVGTLSAGTVRRWYSQLVRRSGPGSLTPAKSYRLLRTILNTAVADGVIARNPCAIVGAGIERSAERPVATLAQVWALADAVPPHFRALVLTAAFGGLRFGELAGLTRDCVDLTAGTITVRRALVQRDDGTLQLGPPKSEAGRRTFTIPAALVPELASHLDKYVEKSADALGLRRCQRCAPATVELVGALEEGDREGRRSRSAPPRPASHVQHPHGRDRCEHPRADAPHGPRLAAGRPALPARNSRT